MSQKQIKLTPDLEEKLKSHLKSKKPLLGQDSPWSGLLQGMVNAMLDGEMDHHLQESRRNGKKNKRNGHNHKHVLTEGGMMDVSTPRDRAGTFEPELIAKRQRQLSSGLDKQILALYAQGNSVEDVRRLLTEMYGVDISAGKISQITDQVLEEMERWRNRRLEAFYPILYMDAMYFKVRDQGKYVSKAFYTVYSVNWHGERDLLGLYVNHSEGAHRWGIVMKDLVKRGLRDILVICVDDLRGFSEVINEEFPQSIVQKCIVHQVRNSLKYVDDKEMKKVASDLKKIYRSATEEQAKNALKIFEKKWGEKYGYIVDQWRQKWTELMAFLDFESEIRRMIYTTNPVEALHRIIRKLIKGKAAWVSETALTKQMYMSLMHNKKSWKKRAYNWKSIQRELLRLYPDRINAYLGNQ